jgi:hypothetical protein
MLEFRENSRDDNANMGENLLPPRRRRLGNSGNFFLSL